MKIRTQPILILLLLAGGLAGFGQTDKLKNVVFEIKPAGAIVVVDDVVYGQAPISITLTRGYHRITISKPGFLKVFDEIVVDEKTNMVKYKLVPITKQNMKYYKNVKNSVNDYHKTYHAETNLNLNEAQREELKLYTKRRNLFGYTALGFGAMAVISAGIAAENYWKYQRESQYVETYRKRVQFWDVVTYTSISAGIICTGIAIHYGKKKRKIEKAGKVEIGLVQQNCGAAIAVSFQIP